MYVAREASLTRLLDPLRCATLRRLAREYGLKLPGRAKKAELAFALVAYPAVEYSEVLTLLTEDELRHVCRQLGLLVGGGKLQLVPRLRRALRWLPFSEARDLLHWIGLKTAAEYHAWSKRSGRPPGVPASPPEVYKDAGWSGWGDFLGTGRLANKDLVFRPFEEAREYVRSLGLAGRKEWSAFARGKRAGLKKPDDIPAQPDVVYAEQGWLDFGDWLGTGYFRGGSWRPFAEAREYARSLGLQNSSQWKEHRKRDRVTDIPLRPAEIYVDEWAGWGDFLGTGNVAPSERVYLPFEEARAFVRGLGLLTSREWSRYSAGRDTERGPRPLDVPAHPDTVYRDDGWQGWRDWLGTSFLPFKQARAFARSLGLSGLRDWQAWCRGEFPDKPPRPPNVPVAARKVYLEQGWQGWTDWLGS